jgi:hypothetical protein
MPKLSPEAVRRLVTALQQDDDEEKEPARPLVAVKVAPTRSFAVQFCCKLTGDRHVFSYVTKEQEQ